MFSLEYRLQHVLRFLQRAAQHRSRQLEWLQALSFHTVTLDSKVTTDDQHALDASSS
jgi:hypothetical protein